MVKQQYEKGCPIQESLGEWLIANGNISIRDSVLAIRTMEKEVASGEWESWVEEELRRRIIHLKNGIVDLFEEQENKNGK